MKLWQHGISTGVWSEKTAKNHVSETHESGLLFGLAWCDSFFPFEAGLNAGPGNVQTCFAHFFFLNFGNFLTWTRIEAGPNTRPKKVQNSKFKNKLDFFGF